MRRHFHRCRHLRVISVDASDLSHARKGGSQVLEELCDAQGLVPCVGLAECDVLTDAQKRELLVARTTRLREEEGGVSPLADRSDPRAEELRELQRDLLEERQRIADENRRRWSEEGGALRRNPRPLPVAQEAELAVAGVSVFDDESLRELRSARLDAIDRPLHALARGRYGECARCHRSIETRRLRIAPDTVLCVACAREAQPDEGELSPRARS